MYHNNPKYWNRKAQVNATDQDQMLQNILSGSTLFATHPAVFQLPQVVKWTFKIQDKCDANVS